ncbi:DUF2169 family type VI secretion system accessory protein [Sorangium sp. So ce426]|uniref:DUF2169 family type VI secretion system accessory protein n=1 Tax=unclassified Sorangium TaxID=2621164 RepID=UPI003F5C2907
MWQLVNHTPYAAERCFARDRRGAEVWLVAVKGTFAIRDDGTTEVADAQEPVALAPLHFGDPDRSSLRYDADLVLTKPGTDVLVHGRAHAPNGKPAARVEVGLRCGPIAKRLVVVGDRTYRRGVLGVVPSEPEPFVEMPIRYERAFGGADPETSAREPRNPAGVGFAERAQRLLGRPAPNIEDPGAPISSAKDRPTPAGFGPLARGWAPRRALAGTFDRAWEEERMPLLPADFDDLFFFGAPADQRVPGFLREGTPVDLLHLTPGGLLRFRLPRTRPCFRTSFGREAAEHRARLHTVIIEPDARRVILVWHTALPCHGKEHRLEHTRIWEKTYV